MNTKYILIILGEPNSVFSEILFKFFKSKIFRKTKKNIILIGNKELLYRQMRKLKYKFALNGIKNIKNSKKKKINILNINYNSKKIFSKITSNSNNYINKSFKTAINIALKNKNVALIN